MLIGYRPKCAHADPCCQTVAISWAHSMLWCH